MLRGVFGWTKGVPTGIPVRPSHKRIERSSPAVAIRSPLGEKAQLTTKVPCLSGAQRGRGAFASQMSADFWEAVATRVPSEAHCTIRPGPSGDSAEFRTVPV